MGNQTKLDHYEAARASFFPKTLTTTLNQDICLSKDIFLAPLLGVQSQGFPVTVNQGWHLGCLGSPGAQAFKVCAHTIPGSTTLLHTARTAPSILDRQSRRS